MKKKIISFFMVLALTFTIFSSPANAHHTDRTGVWTCFARSSSGRNSSVTEAARNALKAAYNIRPGRIVINRGTKHNSKVTFDAKWGTKWYGGYCTWRPIK